MIDIEYIRKKYYVEGWSIRKLSRNLGHARQTIRKAIAGSHNPKYEMKNDRSSPVMDPYRDIILEWLEADENAPKKQKHTAKRIYDRLMGLLVAICQCENMSVSCNLNSRRSTSRLPLTGESKLRQTGVGPRLSLVVN